MKFTMSKAGLLLHCRYPFAEERKWPWEKPSPAAQKGNAVHAEIDAYVRSEVRPKSAEALAAVRYLQLSVSDSTEMRSEVGFAWNWVKDTARMLPETGKHRDYSSLSSEEVAGTADLLLYPARSWLPTLLDWKTGIERNESAQLALLGHVARLASEVVRLDSFAVYLRADAPAKPVHYPVPDHANAVRTALSLIPGSEPNPGPWCQNHFCPLRKTCPALQPGYVAKEFSLPQHIAIKEKPKEEPMPGRLQNLTKGQYEAPLRIFIYGPEGVGKSTFAAGAPRPIWLGLDAGTQHLNIDRLPPPTSWEDVKASLVELRDEAHDYRTLVIDPLNWMEPLIFAAVCKKHEVDSIELVLKGYGKGYTEALAYWREAIELLKDLSTKRAMNVILVAHSRITKIHPPEAESFDRYQPAMNDKAAELFRQYADFVLFARIPIFTTDVKGERPKGRSTNQREIRSAWSVFYDGKSRPQIQDPLPLDYATFAAARTDAATRLTRLQGELAALLETVDGDTALKARAYCADDPQSSSRIEEVLTAIRSKQQQDKPKEEPK